MDEESANNHKKMCLEIRISHTKDIEVINFNLAFNNSLGADDLNELHDVAMEEFLNISSVLS